MENENISNLARDILRMIKRLDPNVKDEVLDTLSEVSRYELLVAGIKARCGQETESATKGSNGEPMLPAGEWEELPKEQRHDIRAMKDRMVRHLNAEVEAFYQEYSEIKVEYRFQVEVVRR